ncbi:hypothetical protein M8C21_010732 [Ambrosia artemisiifolia]|uniref:Uncharacterized protein n=1 Tax=Ambrosia artemisiifolia TaxID=4212 RepID=A0AAD5GFE2_AMBAR|nr:hypothetical protein M8C21_010732 [Ambrosia artemisiifolia]
MFSIIRSLPIETKPAISNLLASSNNFAEKATPVIRSVKFEQASAGNQEPDNMDKKEEAKEVEKKGDVMSHSFGVAYATRSDDEGFGGTYGGNQSLSHDDEDKIVHGNSPEYDTTQGSEVKEKEKARHQTQQANS